MKMQFERGKRKRMVRAAAALMAGLLFFETVQMDALAAEPADGKEVAKSLAETDTVSGNDSISKSEVVAEEEGIVLYTEASDVTTGTLGANGGFTYSYDNSTETCTITGTDSNLYLKSVCADAEKIILKDCTLYGSMRRMFFCFESLQSVEFVNCDTSRITDMSEMFFGCTNLTSLDWGGIDTSMVTSMSNMFYNCLSLTELDLTELDTSKVKSMNSMFYGCKSLTSLDLSNFDTSEVTNMGYMFDECINLKELNLDGFDTSKVTDMQYMFGECQSLTELDLSCFDVSNSHNENMLWNCFSLATLYTPKAISSYYYYAVKLPYTYYDEKGMEITDYLSQDDCKKALVLKKYDISYVLNGGTNNSSNQEGYTIKTATTTLGNPVKTGYTFAGWYTDPDFKTRVTQIGGGSTGNITLYAKWIVNKYNIAFNGNGATSGKISNLTNLEYDTTYLLSENAFAKTGYTYAGWNTKADGTGTAYQNLASVKNLTATNGATVTLYAQWTANKYTIKFDGNGATGGRMSSLTNKVYDTTYTLTGNGFTKLGYTFVGWNTKANGSGTSYQNLASVKNLMATNGASVTLYAQWNANQYTIKFSGNGATSGKMSSLTNRAYGKSYKLTANKYKRKGYTFTGWNTKKDGSGKTYKNRASVKNLSSTNKKSVTLYAQWKKNTYTIKYNLNGGTNNKKNPKSYTVTTKTITLQKPTKKGYTFKGWYSDKKCTKKVTKIKKGSTGKVTLYAKWVKK